MPPISPMLEYMLIGLGLLIAIPMSQVLKRIGYSPIWALLAFIPLLGIIGLWVLAFRPWPNRAP